MAIQNFEEIPQMIELLKTLPAGTGISTAQLLLMLHQDVEHFDFSYMFDLHNALFKAANKNGLYLDMSKHDGLCEGLPFNLDYAVYQKKAGKKCPRCGHRDTSDILHGMPAFDEAMKNDLDNHRLYLGGCCIHETMPKYHCFSCGKDFGTPPILLTKDGAETYADSVTEIRYGNGGFFDGFTVLCLKKSKKGYNLKVSSTLPTVLDSEINLSEDEWNTIVRKLYGKLFLHEWNHTFDNSHVCDREEWSLEIKLSRGRKRTYSGSNDFPPYWNELQRIMRKLIERTQEPDSSAITPSR